ncbi:MAG: endo-1,4-beta-xylanase [Longimicrobiales bacterium]
MGPRTSPRALNAAVALSCLALIPACSSESPARAQVPVRQDTTPLRTLADRHGLRIGTAADRGLRLTGEDGSRFRALAGREFNMLTPENDMKFARLRPAAGVYDFARADSLVAFAETNGMQVRGHTLAWHNQLASWLTDGAWTKRQTEALFDEHIATVVGRYRGRLVAWDVVNEAIDDTGELRSTFWSDKIGPDYIERAFRAAHAADPDAALFYNDYGIEGLNPKSDSVYAMLRRLRERGAPIHGIGFQAHFELGRVPPREDMARNFERFAALGLRIQVTELDVRVPLPATEEALEVQAGTYRDVVAACLAAEACDTVITWGLTDRESWIPNAFPGWGEALLFDADYRPKPAYWAVHELLSERTP